VRVLCAVSQVRRDAGIGARSQVEILAAEADMYVSRTTGAWCGDRRARGCTRCALL
jgi:hypothetical protein